LLFIVLVLFKKSFIYLFRAALCGFIF
jgi:hypothetical protein